MREDKTNQTSQTSKQKKAWFWPAIYGGIAVLFVGMIWGYTALMDDSSKDSGEVADGGKGSQVTVETNAQAEKIKYPFDEANLENMTVLQSFYDVEADAESREKALLVFNQTYVTNNGITVSMNGEPFEVLAAMSGTVEKVTSDPFMGNEVILSHSNGMQTVYRSVTGILVKEGEQVVQGAPLATTTENEWNPTAGIHLHFEVLQDGVHQNPESYLAF